MDGAKFGSHLGLSARPHFGRETQNQPQYRVLGLLTSTNYTLSLSGLKSIDSATHDLACVVLNTLYHSSDGLIPKHVHWCVGHMEDLGRRCSVSVFKALIMNVENGRRRKFPVGVCLDDPEGFEHSRSTIQQKSKSDYQLLQPVTECNKLPVIYQGHSYLQF